MLGQRAKDRGAGLLEASTLVVGQPAEDRLANGRHMAGRRRLDGGRAGLPQDDEGAPAVVLASLPRHESAPFHAAELV